MLMPKTTVYKNYRMIFRQHEIRFARVSGVVLTISEAPREKILSYDFLRLRIFAPDMRHIDAALFRSFVIHG